ncbi:hypothetical protein SLEP1_g49109 [Rubroshorea leprosula]|uniref:Uncharacterized protein n=1 Tax=Rubroshorea leprosula TaxID=152421 RepID=A0AAV5LYQ9_9ROSI|nr:hypothetical protein SLEP1_g49109 [Rubroshorea leprosula]
MAPVAAASGRPCKQKKMMKMGIRKINVTMKKLRGEMEKIGKEQSSIREQQRKIREKLEKIGTECAQLREETDLIIKQKKWNQILLNLMCKIIKARQDRDFDKAASLASILRDLIAKQKGKGMLMAGSECKQDGSCKNGKQEACYNK